VLPTRNGGGTAPIEKKKKKNMAREVFFLKKEKKKKRGKGRGLGVCGTLLGKKEGEGWGLP